jgi:Phosphotransacetylase
MSTLPEDLKSKALKTPNIPAAVVCPNQESILSAVIEGKNMNFIDPTLIGNKSLITETAKNFSLDISNFNIVEAKDEEESASVACQMSNENKVKS